MCILRTYNSIKICSTNKCQLLTYYACCPSLMFEGSSRTSLVRDSNPLIWVKTFHFECLFWIQVFPQYLPVFNNTLSLLITNQKYL